MIQSFRHKGVERFFLTGSKAGIQSQYAKRLMNQLNLLDEASPEEMNVSGWKWHALKGDLEGHWAVWVDKNWRLTFAFEGKNAVLVDYQGYH